MSSQWEMDADLVRRSAGVFIDALSVSKTEADCDAIAEFVVLALRRVTEFRDSRVDADRAETNEALAAGAIYVLLAALHLLDERGLGHDEAIRALRERLG